MTSIAKVTAYRKKKGKSKWTMNIKTEFTEPECERFRRECNFTEEERAVFDLRVRSRSRVEIAVGLNMSESTVDRRIRSIKRKIHKVL